MIDKALDYHEQAIVYFSDTDINSEIMTMINIGNCYLLTDRLDSAFATYDRAEKFAYSNNDTALPNLIVFTASNSIKALSGLFSTISCA